MVTDDKRKPAPIRIEARGSRAWGEVKTLNNLKIVSALLSNPEKPITLRFRVEFYHCGGRYTSLRGESKSLRCPSVEAVEHVLNSFQEWFRSIGCVRSGEAD